MRQHPIEIVIDKFIDGHGLVSDGENRGSSIVSTALAAVTLREWGINSYVSVFWNALNRLRKHDYSYSMHPTKKDDDLDDLSYMAAILIGAINEKKVVIVRKDKKLGLGRRVVRRLWLTVLEGFRKRASGEKVGPLGKLSTFAFLVFAGMRPGARNVLFGYFICKLTKSRPFYIRAGNAIFCGLLRFRFDRGVKDIFRAEFGEKHYLATWGQD